MLLNIKPEDLVILVAFDAVSFTTISSGADSIVLDIHTHSLSGEDMRLLMESTTPSYEVDGSIVFKLLD